MMECHAFLCSKRKVAESVTLSVAQVFNSVYESWKILPNTENLTQNMSTLGEFGKVHKKIEYPQNSMSTNSTEEEKLIDFESDEEDNDFYFRSKLNHTKDNVQWVNIPFCYTLCILNVFVHLCSTDNFVYCSTDNFVCHFIFR